MYLHLGQSTVITYEEIIGIFDLDATTVSKPTRDYLAAAERNGRIVNVSIYDLPKSFVVCKSKKEKQNIVYISPISAATLLKRMREGIRT